jgi:hypothetical protein
VAFVDVDWTKPPAHVHARSCPGKKSFTTRLHVPGSEGEIMKSLTRRLLFGLPIPYFLASRPADAGPGSTNHPTTTPAVWNRTELYFGTLRPNGSFVTDEDFQKFIDREVTPRFPDGLTLLTGYGQFKNSAGVINKERSHLLILFYPPQMRDASKLIQELRETYKAKFQQESVLRTDGNSFISF